MKIGRFITGILAAALCLSFTAGCGNGTSKAKEESKNSTNAEETGNEEKESNGMHTVFIRDDGKNSKMIT